MGLSSSSHSISVWVEAPAERAYDFLLDGHALGRWALGAFATEALQDGVFRGRSLFDDQAVLVRPVGYRQGWRVEYHVGNDPEHLVPRIVAQVVPGPDLGYEAGRAQITLLAWRHREMSDERWYQLQRCHELEVLLIRAQLERWQTA